MTCRLKCGGTLSFVAALLMATLITSTASVWAQEFPTKPVRMIVPFAPGGGSDLNARRLSDQLSDRLKQPLVVHNMGGAGGNLALGATVSSEPTFALSATRIDPLTVSASPTSAPASIRTLPLTVLTDP